MYEFVQREYYRPDVLGRGLLRRMGLLSTPARSQAQVAVDQGLVERPQLGISAEVLTGLLSENHFDNIITHWRSIKRFWLTYTLDKWFVRSNNALFMVAHRSGQAPIPA